MAINLVNFNTLQLYYTKLYNKIELLTKSDIGLDNITNDTQIKLADKGKANGVASLDANGKVPSSQLPEISSLKLGETSTTAYPGDKGKATADNVNSLKTSIGGCFNSINQENDITSDTIKINMNTVNGGSKQIILNSANSTDGKAGVMTAQDKYVIDNLSTYATQLSIDEVTPLGMTLSLERKNPINGVSSEQIVEIQTAQPIKGNDDGAAGLMSAEDKTKLDKLDGSTKILTQVQYDALTNKSDSVVYFIKG